MNVPPHFSRSASGVPREPGPANTLPGAASTTKPSLASRSAMPRIPASCSAIACAATSTRNCCARVGCFRGRTAASRQLSALSPRVGGQAQTQMSGAQVQRRTTRNLTTRNSTTRRVVAPSSATLAMYSKFRNRVMFPIANEAGRVIAFTGRTLSTDEKAGPKYLNSPETPIYSKGRVLFNLDHAKEALRKLDYAILVEGQMDCISVFAAGLSERDCQLGYGLHRTPDQAPRPLHEKRRRQFRPRYGRRKSHRAHSGPARRRGISDQSPHTRRRL